MRSGTVNGLLEMFPPVTESEPSIACSVLTPNHLRISYFWVAASAKHSRYWYQDSQCSGYLPNHYRWLARVSDLLNERDTASSERFVNGIFSLFPGRSVALCSPKNSAPMSPRCGELRTCKVPEAVIQSPLLQLEPPVFDWFEDTPLLHCSLDKMIYQTLPYE